MKKVAYLSYPHFADCDLPLLKELQSQCDVTYILTLTNATKHISLTRTERLKERGGVFPVTDYPELSHLSSYIDLSKAYVLNMPGKHDLSPDNLWAIIMLVVFIVKRRFNILHLTWPPRYGAFLMYLLRKRMILTMHDPLPHSSHDNLLDRLHRKVAFALIDRFIILNRAQREEFISYYHLENKQVYNSQLGIYTHLQTVKPMLPDSKDYVLFIGNIHPHKGVEYLCEAMSKVQRKLPNAKLIVAGKGKIYFSIDRYLQQGFLELRNHYLSDEELAGLIINSYVVVCPYTDATQSGIIMSAYALDTPVIATDTGGLPEMVDDKHTGFIVPARHSEALAHALETLLTQPGLRKAMSDEVKSRFSHGERSWFAIAKDIYHIYEE